MLRITINGIDVEVSDDIAIQMKMINPAFTKSGFDEAYSYSFILPKTSRNKSVLVKKELPIVISFNNILIARGIASIKIGFKSYSIDFKNDAIDLRNQLEMLELKSLDADIIQVCDEADDANVKIDKWHDHMMNTTVVDSPEVGSHKFPFIQPFYNLNEDSDTWDRNITHGNNAFFINSYYDGLFEKNIGYDSVLYPNTEWKTTVSPCVRIEYIFNLIVQKLSLRLKENSLDSIPEYKQMIHFSTLVLDKVMQQLEFGFTIKYNVHGESFNLIDFIPELYGIDFFNMLNDLFGLVITSTNGQVSIRLKIDYFKTPFVDYSKYYTSEYTIDKAESKAIKFIYPIEYNDKDILGNPKWSYRYDTTLGGFVYTLINKLKTRFVGSGKSTEEIQLSYIPLMSIFEYNYITDKRRSRLVYPYNFLSSHYDVETFVGTDKFLVGLIRGIYPLWEVSAYQDRLVFENSHEFEEGEPKTGHSYKFGTCSIYANDLNSHLDVYRKEDLDYSRISDEITKTLHLPLHKILDVISWKEPNHIIKQRNLSFKGCVKEVSFTLYKNRVSPCAIKYAVIADEAKGDYGNDFNNDFLS